MKEWAKKNWMWIAAGVAVIIIFYMVYKAGKKKGTKPHQVNVGSDTVGETIPEQDVQNLKALAENLREDIHEIWGTRDTELYKDLAKLGNNYLVALSNIYNQMFEEKDQETFYQALDNETFWGDTDGRVKGVLDRLRSLGVS